MTNAHNTPPMPPMQDPSITYQAVRAGQYDLAALRLLYGFLVALRETAPPHRTHARSSCT